VVAGLCLAGTGRKARHHPGRIACTPVSPGSEIKTECTSGMDDNRVVEWAVTSNSTAIDLAPPAAAPRSSGQPIISVRDIVHRYQDRTALNGVSFDVKPAELFGLLGPNGSGKTTLFRILSTLMIPSSGGATIAGIDAVRQPGALRRHIGVVFQAQSVDIKLTAYENLWHQGHLYGLRGAELKARITEILTRVGLLERASDLVETFSGGMQRRIELAKGLLHHPEVLLLDEPTTGLDPGVTFGNISRFSAIRSTSPSSSPPI
jgi:ABC-2 type transport system ATP-binding protein